MKTVDVVDGLAAALQAVKTHAVDLRARLAALDGEENQLVRDGHAIEMAPLPWSDRIQMMHEQIDESAERYQSAARKFLKDQGTESLGFRSLNFISLRPESEHGFQVEGNVELQWGAQCYFFGDLTKKRLASLLKTLQSNADAEGLPLAARKAKLAEIATRLAAIKVERDNLFEELRGLSVSTVA